MGCRQKRSAQLLGKTCSAFRTTDSIFFFHGGVGERSNRITKTPSSCHGKCHVFLPSVKRESTFLSHKSLSSWGHLVVASEPKWDPRSYFPHKERGRCTGLWQRPKYAFEGTSKISLGLRPLAILLENSAGSQQPRWLDHNCL